MMNDFHNFKLFIDRASAKVVRAAVEDSLHSYESYVKGPFSEQASDADLRDIVAKIWELRNFLEIYDIMAEEKT